MGQDRCLVVSAYPCNICFYGNKKYYDATELSKKYVDEWIKHESPGKVFLDYACGNGDNAIKAARALFGRNVIARALGVKSWGMVSRSSPWIPRAARTSRGPARTL